MGSFAKFIGRILLTVCTASIAHGILLWLQEQFGIIPAQWVAEVIGSATEPGTLAAAHWFILGVSGLLGFGIWLAIEHWVGRRKPPAASQISLAQRSYVQNEFSKLNAAQKSALRQILVQGHGRNISDQEWDPLESVGFVVRDFNNKQGVKADLQTEIEQLLVASEAAPPSWFELEQRFREMEAPLQFTRLDGQTGAAGEHWRLAGSSSRDAERRFNAVAAMASTRLFQDFPSEVSRYPDLVSKSDPVIRWYNALKFIGGRYEQDLYGEQINDDGTSGGFIFSGSIEKPATASATLCLELASRPIKQA